MQIKKETKTSAEFILYNYFPKYKTLRAMTIEMSKYLITTDNNIKRVNIYVDLYRMFLSLYHRDKGTLTVNTYTSLTSCIINFCAHIRSFYKNIYGMNTTIYLVYNNYLDIKDGKKYIWEKNFFPDYNKDSEDRILSNDFIHKLVNTNISLIKLICQYIDKVYLISRPIESMITIYDLISKEQDKNVPNIIFSSCPLMIQLPANLNNTFIFRLYKMHERNLDGTTTISDYFTVIHRSNAIMEFIASRSLNNEIKEDLMIMSNTINTELLGFIIALCGVPRKEKNIPRLLSTKSVIKNLYKVITNNPKLNCYTTNIEDLYGEMELFKKVIPTKSIVDIDILKNRFFAIDLLFGYNIYLNTFPYHNDNSYIIDLVDPEAVKDINNKFFINNPLDLNRL